MVTARRRGRGRGEEVKSESDRRYRRGLYQRFHVVKTVHTAAGVYVIVVVSTYTETMKYQTVRHWAADTNRWYRSSRLFYSQVNWMHSIISQRSNCPDGQCEGKSPTPEVRG